MATIYITDDIWKCIILNDNFQIIIQISLKFFLQVGLTVDRHPFG